MVELDESLIEQIGRRQRGGSVSMLTLPERVTINLLWRKGVHMTVLMRVFGVSKNTLYGNALTGGANHASGDKGVEVNTIIDQIGEKAAWARIRDARNDSRGQQGEQRIRRSARCVMISGPWGTIRDWERSVERIPPPGLAPPAESIDTPHWDPVGAYADGWEQAEARSANAIRSGAVLSLNDEAIAKRQLQRKLLREGVREALAEAKINREKAEADRRVRAKEQVEEYRRWQAGQAERERKWREQQEAWDKESARIYAESQRKAIEASKEPDRLRILMSKWLCTVCGGKSKIERKNEGYQIDLPRLRQNRLG